MEAEKIQHLIKTKVQAVALEDYKEWAGPTEVEEKVAIEGAITALIKYRNANKVAAYYKKLSEPKVYPIYTAETLYEYLTIERSKFIYGIHEGGPDKGKTKMVIDKWNEQQIKLLCLYFTKDPLFEEKGFSFSKGILLHGNIGCGKTKIMELFRSNPKQSFIIKRCKEISDNYFRALQRKQDPNINIEMLYGKITTGNPEDNFGQTELGIFFDDLGTDDETKFYGNNVNVMGEILLARYNRIYDLKGFTHITTNLSANAIAATYGDRIRSRMREMFNTIEFAEDAPDRRN